MYSLVKSLVFDTWSGLVGDAAQLDLGTLNQMWEGSVPAALMSQVGLEPGAVPVAIRGAAASVNNWAEPAAPTMGGTVLPDLCAPLPTDMATTSGGTP